MFEEQKIIRRERESRLDGQIKRNSNKEIILLLANNEKQLAIQ